MKPRIAIPLPHSGDPEYAARSIPQYERAVRDSGGEPVRIPLDLPEDEARKLIERCHAVVLPGSKADVDPAKFGAALHPKTQPADPQRDNVDRLLLQDAYKMRKPVLGICYGLQALNVHHSGNLLQHIDSKVNHAAGREVQVAHVVEVEPGSRLAGIVSLREGSSSGAASASGRSRAAPGNFPEPSVPLVIPANSSHHQSADRVGQGLKVVARCPEDGIIEALEGTSDDHFVLAVQWHPERSFEDDGRSRAIFRALIQAASERQTDKADRQTNQAEPGP